MKGNVFFKGLVLLCFSGTTSLVYSQQFTKITSGPLVNTPGDSRSVNWIDVNNDGFLDCMITNGPHAGQNNALYINDGNGNFSAVLNDTIVKDGNPSDGATWADTDNDGDVDCFVVNYYDFNNLYYTNNGDGTFTKIGVGSLVNDGGYSETASWGDYDKDGLLDLYVANSSGNLRNFLYHNDGSNSFTKINVGASVTNTHSSRSVNWTDIDNDDDLDFFVTNEANENEDIYRNDGNGSFTLLTSGPLLNNAGMTMSGSWADIDNDGDLDVFLANDQSPNALFLNDGNFSFTKITGDTVVKGSAHSFSSAWSDIDNDGDLDLFVTNAFTGTVKRVNNLYLNDGSGSFSRVSDAPTNDSCWAYGCSFADYDNDGFEDLAVATVRFAGIDPADLLYHNNGNSNHWFTLNLIGTISNRSAIGTKVRVKAMINGNPVWQMREISAQSSYCSQNDPRAHFGLGNASSIDSISVEWPSGLVQQFSGVNVDQFMTLVEGAVLSRLHEIASPLEFLIFPSPAKDHLTISYKKFPQGLEYMYDVIDTNGRILKSGNVKDEVALSGLQHGVYFLRLSSGNLMGVRKFVKE